MAILPVGSPISAPTTNDDLIKANEVRLERATEAKKDLPAPAAALALGVDTARLMINQAAFSPAMTQPTAGVFTVGAVSLKAGILTNSASISSKFSSWGF